MKYAFLTIGLAATLVPTFECFAPRHKKRVALAAQSLHQPVPIQNSEAFVYLRNNIPDLEPQWGWSKTAVILNALRAKKLEAEMKDPASRTRKEHDLDWAIQECRSPQRNKELAEMIMRCAEQNITVNESALAATLEYTRAELKREYDALTKIHADAFQKIKLIKALACLVKLMRVNQVPDNESDIEDYTDQHMFDHTHPGIVITHQPVIQSEPVLAETTASGQVFATVASSDSTKP